MQNSQFIFKVRYDDEADVKKLKRMKSVENPSCMSMWLSEAWMLHFIAADTGMVVVGHQKVGVS